MVMLANASSIDDGDMQTLQTITRTMLVVSSLPSSGDGAKEFLFAPQITRKLQDTTGIS